MGNAVVTGTVDLATLEVTSSDGKPPKFIAPLGGNLSLNGVRVSLLSESADVAVKTINRFTPQSAVTASVGSGSTTAPSSSAPAVRRLILTSPEDLRLDGDALIMGYLGLTAGLTKVSTAAPASAAPVTWASTV